MPLTEGLINCSSRGPDRFIPSSVHITWYIPPDLRLPVQGSSGVSGGIRIDTYNENKECQVKNRRHR
jgi:hypothetical protein